MTTAGRLVLAGDDGPSLALLAGWAGLDRPRRVVALTVLAGFDGARTADGWHEIAARDASALGAQYAAVDLPTRAYAQGTAPADLLAGIDAGDLVLVRASSAEYLTRTLRGTRTWAAACAAWHRGAGLAAAGVAAMALGGDVVGPRRGDRIDGLAVVPHLRLVPGIDGLGDALPHTVLAPLADADATVVGLDAGTALVGEPVTAGPDDDDESAAGEGASVPWAFRAQGKGSAWLIGPERRRRVLAPVRLTVHAGGAAG